MSTVPIFVVMDWPVNPTWISTKDIDPTLALKDWPVNPKPSSTVNDPTEAVEDCPVGKATAPPKPTIEPKVNVADTPEIWATSFGMVTVPKLTVADWPVKSASCEDDPVAVPWAEVIDKPEGNTVWFGAIAVPWLAVNSWPVKPIAISATVGAPTDAVIASELKPWWTSSTVTEPIEKEADIPSVTTGLNASPCEDVIDWPVKVKITSGISTEPILDVIERPDGWATASFNSPHSSSPQDFAPHPVFKVVSAFH